ncbi:unnamed protein product [Paramecium primaurelia]|uniref:sphinganine-1-phosphate aldolase n=1 Tax=Paramecium primaurelia TaxID=5886 RepID=A0A8S1MX49_PARPR|nr:unnamed protein product [Paramecium primaurelia]
MEQLLPILIQEYNVLKQYAKEFYKQTSMHEYTKSFDIFDTAILVSIISVLGLWALRNLRFPNKDYNQSFFGYFKAQIFIFLVNYCPGVNSYIEKQKAIALESFSSSMEKMTSKKTLKIPENGIDSDTMMDKMNEWIERDSKHNGSGKVSGSLYVMPDKQFIKNAQDFCKHFIYSNPMHADLWPATRQMEAEVIRMTGDLFGQEKEGIGIVTTGGTESIILAMLAYRNWGESQKGINKPNIVIPETAHSAFYRAGEYFKIQVRVAKIDQSSFQVDINDLRAKIDSNTVCIVGSFPNFGYGTSDPIEQLASIAKKKKIGLHVDACLGGFTAVFAKDHGVDLGKFDFTLDGVTSISCDQHKHGLAPKGVSTVLFKTKQLREHAFFSLATWSGGAYAVPSMQGSKCGANVAGAWFTLQSIGKKKYIDYSKKIMDATQSLVKSLSEIPEIKVFGNPQINCVAFMSKETWLNVYAIHEILTHQGWTISSVQKPAGIHISLTLQNIGNLKQYVHDIKAAIEKIKANPKEYKKGGEMGTVYGTTQRIPDSKLANQAIKVYLDSLLKI